jgi:hypothetical protein
MEGQAPRLPLISLHSRIPLSQDFQNIRYTPASFLAIHSGGCMRRFVALVCTVAVLSVPLLAEERQPSAQSKGMRAYFKVAFGGLGASIGLGLLVAGKNPDPFTGDRNGGQMALGAGLMGAGAWFMWDGFRDLKDAKAKPQVGIAVTRKSVAVGVRKTW